MRRFFSSITRVTLLLMVGLAAATAQAQKRIVAYVPKWAGLEALSGTIDYKKLTHINIAFENPVNAEGDLSFDPRNEVLIGAARRQGVKVLISIGGGSAATDPILKARYFELLTPEKRPEFVAKLTQYVLEHRFDGLDVDIEGPSINDDYGGFIVDLAAALKPTGKLLTCALSKGYGGDRVPDHLFEHYDFINIMAYDATGPWAPGSPGPHSSFDYAVENVRYWLERGLPKSKAVLGVPFYGHGFGEASGQGDYSYSRILADHPGAEEVDRIGNTIWYNGIPTIRRKAQYVMDEGLGGVMIWSLDADVSDERSLLSVIHGVLSDQEID